MNAYEIERFKMQKFLQDYTILLIPFCFTVKSFIHSNINSIELFAVVFTCIMSSIDYFCTICWEQKFKTKVFYCIFSVVSKISQILLYSTNFRTPFFSKTKLRMKNIFRKFFFEPTRLSQLYPKQKKKRRKNKYFFSQTNAATLFLFFLIKVKIFYPTVPKHTRKLKISSFSLSKK